MDLRIDSITLKNTTKPPIIKIDEIADVIDLLITSPKFEKLTVFLVLKFIFFFL